MNILVRLPNWLGDMVMSMYFVREVQKAYPDAQVSVIAKKGLDGLLDYFPSLKHKFVFSKEEYSGISGLFRFGRHIRSTEKFDLFFCLPDSFSSAFMGWATGATKRVGFKKEGRSFLLTNVYKKKVNVHRIQQYLQLLENYSGNAIIFQSDIQLIPTVDYKEGIVVNIHSEATSRRMPKVKAVSFLNLLCTKYNGTITMIGGPKDAAYTNEVIAALHQSHRIQNLAGKTSLPQLVELFAKSKMLFSSDSGPAHLGNAAGLPVVVLFGAGNENETSPRYKAPSQVIRLGKLSCEPCVRNECKFGLIPPCLNDLDDELVIQTVLRHV